MKTSHETLLLALLGAITPAGCTREAAPTPKEERGIPTRIPSPPFAHVRGVSSAPFAASAPGDQAFRGCDASYKSWPQEASGGPMGATSCYVPPAGAACLALLAPALPRALGLRGGPQGVCVFDEDRAHPDPDPATGQPRCCYTTWQMGMGRPLLVARAPRLAPLLALTSQARPTGPTAQVAGGWG